MRSDKNKALKLRLRGRSYNEIVRLLGIPKATLSGWFTGLELPNEAKRRISNRVYSRSIEALIKRNKAQTHLAEKKARIERDTARNSIAARLSKKELLLVGIALYWAEGHKRPIKKNGVVRTSHAVSLSNSDPELIRLFLYFLRKVCGVDEEKISANLRIYEHQNESQLLEFWSKQTKIPFSRFKRFYYGVSLSSQHKKPFNILPYGTIQIRVNNTALYHRIMGWIDGLKGSC